MNPSAHLEYPPPKSWEQFEELCADTFQAEWNDPELVRHGRAGQRQHGVDIIAKQGANYPVGLQCKKAAQWPVRQLKAADIDQEVSAAAKFLPKLHSFYILTTAPDDTKLQAHVRKINAAQRRKKLFQVVLLGWGEIARRATMHHAVVAKHFGVPGGVSPVPLLKPFFLDNGKLEIEQEDLRLSAEELMLDLKDYPAGRVEVRLRETDSLLKKLQDGLGLQMNAEERRKRIDLRRGILKLQDLERGLSDFIRFVLAAPEFQRIWTEVWANELPSIIRACLEGAHQPTQITARNSVEIEPPASVGIREIRGRVGIPGEYGGAIASRLQSQFGTIGRRKALEVSALPPEVRSKVVLPVVLRELFKHEALIRGASAPSAKRAFDLESWELVFSR